MTALTAIAGRLHGLATLPARRGLRRTPGLLRSLLGRGLVLWLVVLHVVLLAQRIGSRTLLEPVVAVRWLASLALAVIWLRLHRAERSPRRARRVLVFWLLVALLHASFAVPVPGTAQPPATLAETSLLLVTPLWASLLPLLWLARCRRVAADGGQRAHRRPPFLSRFALAPRLTLRSGFAPALANRPPPV